MSLRDAIKERYYALVHYKKTSHSAKGQTMSLIAVFDHRKAAFIPALENRLKDGDIMGGMISIGDFKKHVSGEESFLVSRASRELYREYLSHLAGIANLPKVSCDLAVDDHGITHGVCYVLNREGEHAHEE